MSYHVRLSRPILESALTSLAFTQHITGAMSTNAASLIIVSNVSNTPFNFSATVAFGTPSSLVLSTAANLPINGRYFLIQKVTNGSVTSWVAPPTGPTLAGYTLVTADAPGAGTSIFTGSNTTFSTASPAGAVSAIMIDVPSSGGSITLLLLSSSTISSNFDLWIFPVNTSLSMGQQPVDRITQLEQMVMKMANTERDAYASTSSSSQIASPITVSPYAIVEEDLGSSAVASSLAYQREQEIAAQRIAAKSIASLSVGRK